MLCNSHLVLSTITAFRDVWQHWCYMENWVHFLCVSVSIVCCVYVCVGK